MRYKFVFEAFQSLSRKLLRTRVGETVECIFVAPASFGNYRMSIFALTLTVSFLNIFSMILTEEPSSIYCNICCYHEQFQILLRLHIIYCYLSVRKCIYFTSVFYVKSLWTASSLSITFRSCGIHREKQYSTTGWINSFLRY